MTFNEKLMRAKKEFNELAKEHNGYHKASMPEVLAHNKEYRKSNSGKYAYNDAIKNYILEKEKVDDNLIDYLKTEVYLSQQDIDREEKQAYKNKMLLAGYLELNEQAVKEALERGKRLAVIAKASNDWYVVKIDQIYKPHCFNGKDYGLMKPRAKSRGYGLYQFENAFCKLVD